MTPEQRTRNTDVGTVTRELLVTRSANSDHVEQGTEPPVVQLDAPIGRFADRLLSTDERQLPVCNNGEIVGFVSVTDMVRAIARQVVALDVSVAEVYNDTVDIVSAGTQLPTAVRQLTTASGLSAIVLDEDGAVVGVLTESDVVDAARFTQGELCFAADLADRDADPRWEGIELEGGGPVPTLTVELPAVPVSEIVSEDVPTVSADQSVTDAARVLIARDVEQVAVQVSDQLAGVLRDRDLLYSFLDRNRDD